MADDMDDIEDMLEAPYKSASTNSVANNNSQVTKYIYIYLKKLTNN